MKNFTKIFPALFCILFANSVDAQTTGTVFRDYNGNGTRQTSAPNEPLVRGIIVNAYNSNDALVASYTTTIAGTFSIPLTGSIYNGTPGSNTGSVANTLAVRLEFIIPASGACGLSPNIDYSSGNGSTVGSSVRFITGGTTAITYAVNKPADFISSTNPTVFMSKHTNGNPLGGGNSGTSTWFVGFPYNSSGTTAPTLTLNGTTIGSTWGVAYSKQAGKVFTSAFLKRHAGLGVLGSGGIYMLTPTATSFTVTNFYDLDAVANLGAYRTRADAAASPPAYGAGTSFSLNGANTIATYLGSTDAASGRPIGMGVIGTNVNRGLPNTNNTPNWDPAAFDQVGKVGLGDLEISDDGKYLFVINLYDRKVYRLELNNAYNPTSVVTVTSYALPVVVATNGVLRPFGAKFYRGKLYVGAVGTAENAGTAANLNAHVFELNNATATASFTGTPVVTYPLNYVKGGAMTWTGPYGTQWYPWSNNTSTSVGSGTDRTYPTPVLSNIEFDERGDMIMSFFDRGGHQWSEDNYQNLATSTTLIRYAVGGDILMAGSNCNGTFTIENNGAYTSANGTSYNSGASNNQGPGTSEFFKGDTYTTFHSETSLGALAYLAGSGEVYFGTMDPLAVNTGGTKRLLMSTGLEVAGSPYQLSGASIAGFGKAISLGDIEFLGTLAPIEIGNRLWNDSNGNGIQDAGEAGIQNVSLELYADFNNDGVPDGGVLGTVITTATGEWYFNNSNIADGDPGTAGNQPGLKYEANYIVRVAAVDWNGALGTGIAQLAGFQLTQKDKIGNGQADLSDSDGELSTGATIFPQIMVTVGGAGENNHNLDFGFKPLASLGDKVWRDDNQNGLQDSGEPGVAGITVTLFDNAGVVVGTMVTDAYGIYLFDNLTAATYQVSFTAPPNYNFTTQTNNNDNTTLTGGSTAANGSDVNATTGRTTNIVLSAGENERNIDAGLIINQPLNNSIGDRVWLDSDNNGNQNGTEPGISGITVTLFAADGITIVATTVTDANGNYIFTGLPAGTNYIVGLTLPVGLTYTSTAGTTAGNATINSDVSATTGKSTLINTGAAGNQITGIDAGLILTGPTTASLGDKVWIDLPGGLTNVQDAGEPGLAGVTVNLYRDANGDGFINGAEATTPYATTVTDVFGYYIFNNLPATVTTGTRYEVGFVLPIGYSFVIKNTGTDETKDSDVDIATGRTKVYKIAQGQRNLSIDAGLIQISPAGTAKIGDKVWFDANNDGSLDLGEPDVAGVTVTLYNNIGIATGTTTTDANGYYQFINLAAGTYSIGFSNLPLGYSFTSSAGTTSASGTINSDVNPGTGRTTNFAVIAGESLQGLDAGLIAGVASGSGSIGNKIWYDLPGGTAGVQEAGELGVAGVIVTLLDAGLDGIVGNGDDGASRTTTSNALGEYIFTGLSAGNYAVQFSNLPGSYTVTTANAGSNDIVDSDGGAVGTGGAPAGASRTGVYNLGEGVDNMTVDLGLIPPVNTNTLGNYVWFDTNNDGIQDVSERGLAGVMVTLYNNAGSAIAYTTTNTDGEYLFTGLADGNYSTGFTNLPAGFNLTSQSLTNTTNGSDADLTNGRTGTVALNAGNRNDRSLDAGFISTRAALGNFVWMDNDGNGIQNVAEPGVTGVTVTLFRPGFGPDGIAGNGDDALAVASMITDQNGQYLFENLLAGTYQVAFTTIPTGIRFTLQDAGGNDNLDSDVNPATGLTGNVILAAGDINLSVDAGLFTPRAVIGNYVWADKNSNGVQDATEPGISGILITLFLGGNPVAVAVTNANGGYLFPNVAPGTYSMQFTNLPTGVSFTVPDAGGNDNFDSDVIGSTITGIVVTTTTVNLTFDAGVLNSITLPIQIVFTANKKNETAELTWKLSGDVHEVKEFAIERSANGISYSAIGNQLADGRTTYQKIDLQPNTGINYYRIKVIHHDGSIKYSDTRILIFNGKGTIIVFPNPVTEVINIQLPDSWQGKAVSIDLINTTGQVVATKTTKQASQVETMQVRHLPSGVYILRIQDGNGNVETRKMQVN